MPIPGTTKLARLEENVAAASLTLSAEDLRELSDAAAKLETYGARYPEHLERMTGR